MEVAVFCRGGNNNGNEQYPPLLCPPLPLLLPSFSFFFAFFFFLSLSCWLSASSPSLLPRWQWHWVLCATGVRAVLLSHLHWYWTGYQVCIPVRACACVRVLTWERPSLPNNCISILRCDTSAWTNARWDAYTLIHTHTHTNILLDPLLQRHLPSPRSSSSLLPCSSHKKLALM